MSDKPVIILGNGSHARVLIDCLKLLKVNIIGVTVEAGSSSDICEPSIIGSDDEVFKFKPDHVLLVNGLGFVGRQNKRNYLYMFLKDKGYSFKQVLHPSAIIADNVQLGEGLQVMAGAVIQPGCSIGANSIINTRTSIDHDCKVGENVHIAPGVTISGGVVIGKNSLIGTGSTIIQDVIIGEDVIIGAGSLLLSDIPGGVKAYGCPAKVVKQ